MSNFLIPMKGLALILFSYLGIEVLSQDNLIHIKIAQNSLGFWILSIMFFLCLILGFHKLWIGCKLIIRNFKKK